MTHTYAIADLHGRDDLLQLALGEIGAREGDAAHAVVFTGDYVDRGPESARLLSRLKTGPKCPNHKWVILKGNHEDIMLQACANDGKVPWWFQNGGANTIISYRDNQKLLEEHLIWLSMLPLTHTDQHRIFVHAGMHAVADKWGQRGVDHHIWMGYPDDFDNQWNGRHVVHGHDQRPEDGPLLLKNRTNLDTGAWHTGRLCVAVFDDAVAGGPVEIIEIKGKTIDELMSA